jgi:hypothetical protein
MAAGRVRRGRSWLPVGGDAPLLLVLLRGLAGGEELVEGLSATGVGFLVLLLGEELYGGVVAGVGPNPRDTCSVGGDVARFGAAVGFGRRRSLEGDREEELGGGGGLGRKELKEQNGEELNR